jgi:hypothetical protein
MGLDWTLFSRYAAPILALFAGAALQRFLEKRPKLVIYLAHSSAVTVRPPDGQPTNVHTHSVVVRNAGRKSANNVRIGHQVLPDFSIFPSIKYEVSPLAGGGSEILFPSLVAGEQVTVTYLYFPPLLWSGVNSYTKSDEGFAKALNVLPTPQAPQWLQRVAWFFLTLGIAVALYGLGQALLFVRHVAAK